MLTMEELTDKLLIHFDADLLIELLQISAPELLERFEDKLELHFDKLMEAVEDYE